MSSLGRVDWGAWRRDNPAPKEWTPEACPWCGATTAKEAETKCRPQSLPSGDYECGTPEEAPRYFGKLHQRSKAWLDREGDFWGLVAYDEGLTNNLDDEVRKYAKS